MKDGPTYEVDGYCANSMELVGRETATVLLDCFNFSRIKLA